jgi:hypothetical protein
MRLKTKAGGLLAIAMSAVAVAQTPDVSGTWLADSNESHKWVLEQKSGKIHVEEMNGEKVEANFTCSLSGEECAVKEDGRSEKLMMYFNGEKLVEIRERGTESVKRWIYTSEGGKKLTVETVPLSPLDRSETQSFHRQGT